MQTEYLTLQGTEVTTRTFFPRTEKHCEQCCVDGPLTTVHYKKMTIAPIIPMTNNQCVQRQTFAVVVTNFTSLHITTLG